MTEEEVKSLKSDVRRHKLQVNGPASHFRR
jgi:hypothetical protein